VSESLFRTDDLSLAVTLSLARYNYTMAKLTERKVVWDFCYKDKQEDDFYDIVHDFWEFKTLVEPRAFTLRWGEMRRELFRLVPPARQSEQAAAAQ
jgi:hypothetical protein